MNLAIIKRSLYNYMGKAQSFLSDSCYSLCCSHCCEITTPFPPVFSTFLTEISLKTLSNDDIVYERLPVVT